MSFNRYKQRSHHLSSLLWQINYADLNFDIVNSSKSLDSTRVSTSTAYFCSTVYIPLTYKHKCTNAQKTHPHAYTYVYTLTHTSRYLHTHVRAQACTYTCTYTIENV